MTQTQAVELLQSLMEKTVCMDISVRQEVSKQQKDLQIVTAPVYRTRSGAVHNVWLFAAACEEYGIRIVNITSWVAVALGEKLDPNTGGIKSPVTWMTNQQVYSLSELVGFKLQREGF